MNESSGELELTPENAADVLRRFSRFGDALVERFVVERGSGASVVVSVRAGTSWTEVVLAVREPVEWRWSRVRSATEVVFDADIAWFDDVLYVSLDGPVEGNPRTHDAFRQSQLFLAGRSGWCRWTTRATGTS